jgi:YfiH family protein
VCAALEPFAAHLFTTRSWVLGEPVERPIEGWRQVEHVVGAPVLKVRQVHGRDVLVHRAGDEPRLVEADIIISDDPAFAIAIRTADCVPLLLANRRTGAVAAAHAGWRGLAAGVPEAAAEALARISNGATRDIVAAVGPAISAPRYEVGVDVWRSFQNAGFAAAMLERWFSPGRTEGRWQFDGWAAACDELETAGVPRDQIYASRLCTASYPGVFCSYRRDGPPAGRMVAVIRCPARRP